MSGLLTTRQRGTFLGAIAVWMAAALAPGVLAQQPSTRSSENQFEAGAVATVPVVVPEEYARRQLGDADSGEILLDYSVGLTPGFRLIGDRNGSISWRDGERAVLLLTIQLPPTAPGGKINVGSVQFADGEKLGPQVAVAINVAHTREFEIAASSSAVFVEPGSDLEIEYELHGSGNVGDTVMISLEPGPGFDPSAEIQSLWLPAFGSRSRRIMARVAPDAEPGSEMHLRVLGRNGEHQDKAMVRVFVRGPEGPLPGLAQVPTSIFLGSTLTSAGGQTSNDPLFGISGRGEVARNTEVLFSYRSGDSRSSSFVFQDVYSSPRLQLGIRRPEWSVLAGDVDVRTSDLLGYYQAGRGAAGTWSRGRGFVNAIGARPQSTDGGLLDGHVAALEAGWGEQRVRISGLLSSTDRSNVIGLPGSRTQAALGRFEGRPARGHIYSVDAGWMRIRDNETGEETAGPSFNARYSYRDEDRSLDLTARRRPMTSADPRIPPQLFQLSGSARISADATVLGSVFDEILPAGLGADETHSNGGYLGVRLGRRPLAGEITTRVRARYGGRNGHLGTVRGALWTRAGPIDLDATVELGPESMDGESGTFRQYRLGASVRRGHTWARLSARYTSDLRRQSLFLYEGYLSHNVGSRLEAYLSASAYDGGNDLDASLSVQMGAAFRIRRDMRAYLGIENLSRELPGTSRWRMSAGIQQGFGLPLPLRRPSAVDGIVFEDLNANGSYEPGEPTLDGVRVSLGLDEVYTRNGGRFEFREELGNRLSIDAGSLGPEYLPPGDILFQPGERVMVPVSRAGSLQVDLFLDEDRDGQWDEGEPAIPGVVVEVHSEAGAGWRLRTGPDGRLILDAVRPGQYRIEIDRTSLPGTASSVEPAIIEIRGGEQTLVPIAVPLRHIPMATFGSFEPEVEDLEDGSGGR
jgi:hypothetical protein